MRPDYYSPYLDYIRCPQNIRGAVTIKAEILNTDVEWAIIKACDFGLASLTPDEQKWLERFLTDAALRIKNKL